MPSFHQLDQRATAGESLTIAFFGGSLTWGAQATNPQVTSYRALVSREFERRYPAAHFRFWDAAIGGTGSQLAAFRLERDIQSKNPDLVFLDFTINDDPFSSTDSDRLAAYESIIRRLICSGIPIVQVILPAKIDVLPQPPARPLDEQHKAIGQAYALPLADAVILVKTCVADGKTTPDALWDLPQDATHPGDAGYALYAQAAWQAYLTAIQHKSCCTVPDKMLFADTYMTVTRYGLCSSGKWPAGWQPGIPNRNAIAYDFIPSRWMDSVAVASRDKDLSSSSPEPLILFVRGRNLFFFGEGTPTSGKYHIHIDGKEVKTVDIGAQWKTGAGRYFEMLAQGLNPAVEHKVEIIPELQPDQELRLESLCIAGAPATAERR